MGGGHQARGRPAASPGRARDTPGRRFAILPLDATVLEAAAELAHHPGDPFYRALTAHAIAEHLPILTRDAAFASYDVHLVPA